jgi:hypothetical protein
MLYDITYVKSIFHVEIQLVVRAMSDRTGFAPWIRIRIEVKKLDPDPH